MRDTPNAPTGNPRSATKPPGGGNGYPDGDVLMLQLWQSWAERTGNPEAGQLFKRIRVALFAARQKLAAISELCKETDDLYCDSDDLARFYASTIEKIEALAATQEER